MPLEKEGATHLARAPDLTTQVRILPLQVRRVLRGILLVDYKKSCPSVYLNLGIFNPSGLRGAMQLSIYILKY